MTNNSSHNTQNWNNLTERQCVARLAREARLAGSWDAARDLAEQNLEPDEVEDLMNQAHKYLDSQRTW